MQELKKSFTLVEIMVVIAIISALSAILFSVFVSIKRKNRETVCTSQLRQISTALQMYRQDYDGNDTGTTYDQLGLPKSIDSLWTRGYIHSEMIRHCPDYKVDPWWSNHEYNNQITYKSYASYKNYWKFSIEYQKNNNWPAIFCDTHDYDYYRGYPLTTNNLTLLCISLNGTISKVKDTWKYHPEWSNDNTF